MTQAEKEALNREWKKRIENFQVGGQSQLAYCKAENLDYRQFRYWLEKFTKSASKTKAPNNTQWLAIKISDQKSAESKETLTVKIGRAEIEIKPGFNPQLFIQTVKLLSEIC